MHVIFLGASSVKEHVMYGKMVLSVFACLAIVASANATPISSWCFEEAGGTTAVDSWDGNDGTIAASASRVASGSTTGPYDQVFSTNGSGGVTVPDSSNLDITGSFSVQAWIHPTSAASVGTIVNKWEGRGWSLSFGNILGGTRCQMYIYDGLNFADHLYATSWTVPLNTWTHIAVTYDVASPNTFNFYRNGVNTTNPVTVGSGWTGPPLLVNNGPVSIAPNFVGMVDEVAVFDYAVATGGSYPDYDQTLIPEPVSLSLLLAGVVALGFRRKR